MAQSDAVQSPTADQQLTAELQLRAQQQLMAQQGMVPQQGMEAQQGMTAPSPAAQQGMVAHSQQGLAPGDWMCPQCGTHNSAQNSSCRNCGTGNPDPMKSVAAVAEGIAAGFADSGPAGPAYGQTPQPGDWYCPGCHDLQFARNSQCRKCGMANPNAGLALMPGAPGESFHQQMMSKPGDWSCPACGDLQFAKNPACRKCGTPNPDPQRSYNEMVAGMQSGHHGVIPKAGDWYCPGCHDLQFAKNVACRKCGTPNPYPNGTGDYSLLVDYSQGTQYSRPDRPMKPGDWHCPSCGDLQFSRNIACRKCGTAKPPGASPTQKPGDWHCPSCNDLQFAKNSVCRRCNTPNPNPEGSMRELGQAMAERVRGREKPGDWYCPQCGDLQFARNMHCRKCATPNPDPETSRTLSSRDLQGYTPAQKPGDWYCPKCGDLQFARNTNCRRCNEPNPDPETSRALSDPGPRTFLEKPGDWRCPNCGEHNFSRNMQCRRCGTPNPAPMGSSGSGRNTVEKPGDWYCPACGDLQFARNSNCRRCSTPNPAPRPPPPAPPPQQQQPPPAAHAPPALALKRPGDWHCVNCGELQSANTMECRSCGSPNFAAMVESQWGMKGGFANGKDGGGKDGGGKDGFGSMDSFPSGKGAGKDGWTSDQGGGDDGWMSGKGGIKQAGQGKLILPPAKRGRFEDNSFNSYAQP